MTAAQSSHLYVNHCSLSGLPCHRQFAVPVRKVFAEKPQEFDPRKYLGPARDEMEKLYKEKIINVLGSNGKAE